MELAADIKSNLSSFGAGVERYKKPADPGLEELCVVGSVNAGVQHVHYKIVTVLSQHTNNIPPKKNLKWTKFDYNFQGL